MKVSFHTGVNARFPQQDYYTIDPDDRGGITHALRPRMRRWAELEIGRENIHIDLGWADDPDSLDRQHAIEGECRVESEDNVCPANASNQ